jgi:hypothetical protein
MATNHTVGEEVNVYERVKDNDVDVGDTIEVISDNQEGYKKYKVVNNLGKKGLMLINSYDDFMSGGRRRTRKHKRKSNKRKSNKRKSRKNKKSKRKSHKRRSHKRKM